MRTWTGIKIRVKNSKLLFSVTFYAKTLNRDYVIDTARKYDLYKNENKNMIWRKNCILHSYHSYTTILLYYDLIVIVVNLYNNNLTTILYSYRNHTTAIRPMLENILTIVGKKVSELEILYVLV